MTEKLAEFSKSYWPVIIGLVAVAVAWGASTAQIAWIGDGQKTISVKLDRIAEDVASVRAGGVSADRDIAELRLRMHALEARR